MFKKSLLAAAAGGVVMFAALAGATGTAQAHGTSVHVGIGAPAYHHHRTCWLPERHLCGPRYHRPVYRAPVYVGPVYGGPVYGGPVYGGPVYGAPVYGLPVYTAPSLHFSIGRGRHW